MSNLELNNDVLSHIILLLDPPDVLGFASSCSVVFKLFKATPFSQYKIVCQDRYIYTVLEFISIEGTIKQKTDLKTTLNTFNRRVRDGLIVLAINNRMFEFYIKHIWILDKYLKCEGPRVCREIAQKMVEYNYKDVLTRLREEKNEKGEVIRDNDRNLALILGRICVQTNNIDFWNFLRENGCVCSLELICFSDEMSGINQLERWL